jgi:hypothetical protein
MFERTSHNWKGDNNMTVAEVKQEKEILEIELLKLIQSFERRSECFIDSIDLMHMLMATKKSTGRVEITIII